MGAAHGGQILMSAGGGRSRRAFAAARRDAARAGPGPAEGPGEPGAHLSVASSVAADRVFRRCARSRARPTICPQQLNSFVGREREMAEVRALLDEGQIGDAAGHGRRRQVAVVGPTGRRGAGRVSGRRLVDRTRSVAEAADVPRADGRSSRREGGSPEAARWMRLRASCATVRAARHRQLRACSARRGGSRQEAAAGGVRD